METAVNWLISAEECTIEAGFRQSNSAAVTAPRGGLALASDASAGYFTPGRRHGCDASGAPVKFRVLQEAGFSAFRHDPPLTKRAINRL